MAPETTGTGHRGPHRGTVVNRALFCLALALAATACSQEVPSLPTPAAAAPVAQANLIDPTSCAASARESQAVDARVFSITLVGEPKCSGTDPVAATAQAKWDVTSLQATDVSIYVSSPGNERKLWLDGKASGDATTGPWVFENSCFALQDKASGRLLAARLVGAIACAR